MLSDENLYTKDYEVLLIHLNLCSFLIKSFKKSGISNVLDDAEYDLDDKVEANSPDSD